MLGCDSPCDGNLRREWVDKTGTMVESSFPSRWSQPHPYPVKSAIQPALSHMPGDA